jgi:flagellin
MSLVLNTNINSLVAQNSLTSSGNELATSLQQLSSGLRINTAADDAAGYAIVQGMTSQINGLSQAAQNAGDGVSLAQTAQGSLTEITNDLQTMRDLAVESLNATNSSQDRADLDQQFQQLSADVDNVAQTSSFNGVNLLDGSFKSANFQIGANEGQTINVAAIASSRTSALGVYAGFNTTDLAVGTTGTTTITVGSGTAVSLGSVTADASDVAAAINSAGVAGLTATANANAAVGTSVTEVGTSGNAADTIQVNGINVAVTNTGNQTTNIANAISALNAVSAATGVTATNNGSGITLTATNGSNITVKFTAGTAGASPAVASAVTDYGLGTIGGSTAVTTKSTVNVDYVAPSGVSGSVVFAGALASTQAIASTGTSIAASNVLSVTNANAALTSIDAALQQVASTGAQLGAYQNRFQAAITGLNTTSTNLQSARSSIQDTDYAQATSDLSKAQIVQQASTAMVAQANTVPQNVLTLLQKLP